MHLRVILVATALWLYVTWRFVPHVPLATGWKVVLAIVLLALAEYYVIVDTLFGGFARIELPRWAMVGIGWAFGAFVLLVMLLVLRDLVGIATWLISRAGGRWLLTSQAVTGWIGVTAMVLAVYGTWQGIRVPRVKTVDITLPTLPPAFDGYRIVQLSDIHASPLLPRTWIAAMVKRTNGVGADLIVVTGDLQDGTPAARADDVAPLADLTAPDGVLVIAGNHEYYTDYAGWMQALRGLGLQVLENAHVLIRRDGAALAVAGITDRQAAAFGQPPPDVAAATAGTPEAAPVILLSHHPDNARANATKGIALQLSGHTHGGQVLGFAQLAKRANDGFVSGLYRVGPMQLYVSNGTGLWNGFAIRIGRPSEITNIVLHAGTAENDP